MKKQSTKHHRDTQLSAQDIKQHKFLLHESQPFPHMGQAQQSH